jgi:hypothetical protein
LSKT